VSIPSPMDSTMIPASWEGCINLKSCILRRRYKSEHWRGVTGSHKSATGVINKILSRLPTFKKGKQTSSSKKACKSSANEKSPPNPSPNQELKHP
jgi:hypothetical protein